MEPRRQISFLEMELGREMGEEYQCMREQQMQKRAVSEAEVFDIHLILQYRFSQTSGVFPTAI